MSRHRPVRIHGSLQVSVLAFFSLITAALGQSVGDFFLEDLRRYLSAAARLMANAVVGVDRLEAANIPSPQARSQISNELREVSKALSALRSRQGPLVQDLTEFIAGVREGRFDTDQRNMRWSEILDTILAVAPIVGSTLDVVERSASLRVALKEEDRLALRETLQGRANILGRISGLPAPRTPFELQRLDRMNAQYKELMESLHHLNIAITRAADRLNLN